MSWIKKGEDIKKPEFFDTGSQKRKNEFWLKEGNENSRKVIFLDDPQIGFSQHGLKIGENFESVTCLGEDCAACAQNFYKTPAMPFTILDLTPYTDKEGKERKYFKKIYLAKGKKVIEMLNSRRDSNGGTLAGLKMKITRSTEKDPACGNDFIIEARVDLKKLSVDKPEDLKPYDYESLYAPLSKSQLEAKLKYAASPNSKKKKATVSRAGLTEEFGDSASIDFESEPTFNAEESIPF